MDEGRRLKTLEKENQRVTLSKNGNANTNVQIDSLWACDE